MLVQDIISKAGLVLSPGWTVGDAAKECAAMDIFIAPVADGGKYCGVFRVSSDLNGGTKNPESTVKEVLEDSFPVALKDKRSLIDSTNNGIVAVNKNGVII